MVGKHALLRWLPLLSRWFSIGHLRPCRAESHNCGRRLTTLGWLLRSANKKSALDRIRYRNVALLVLVLYLWKTHIEDSYVGCSLESSEDASSRRIRTRLLSHLSLFGVFPASPDERLRSPIGPVTRIQFPRALRVYQHGAPYCIRMSVSL